VLWRGTADRCLEQPHGHSSRNGPTVGGRPDRHGHHRAIESEIKDLLAVTTPSRLCPALSRDQHPPASTAERFDVHFVPARLAGLVGNPLAVRTELRVEVFVK